MTKPPKSRARFMINAFGGWYFGGYTLAPFQHIRKRVNQVLSEAFASRQGKSYGAVCCGERLAHHDLNHLPETFTL